MATGKDTRGWKPKETANQTLPDADTRCGKNTTPRVTISINYPQDAARIPEKGVEMDNMGNSPSNNGKNVTPKSLAETVDSAPDVPLSSYEGVGANFGAGGGISLDEGFRTQIAEREMREKVDHAMVVPNIVKGEITSGHEKFNQATIQGGFDAIQKDMFTGDGMNPKNVESKDMGDQIAPKQSPEFQGTVAKRQK